MLLLNYFRVALRNLRRNKASSTINVLGMVVGLACSILIFLFVRSELRVDSQHERGNDVYRLTYEEENTVSQRRLATTSPPMGPAISNEFADVVDFVRLRTPHKSIFSYQDKSYYEENFFYADSSFFKFFTYRFVYGDAQTSLSQPNSIVVSDNMARKYFGDSDPLGRTISMNDEVDLTVTGVFVETDDRSHLQFDFLVSFSTFEVPFGYPVTLDSWGWISFHTYVMLAEDAVPASVEQQIGPFIAENITRATENGVRIRLQPIPEIYLGDLRHPVILSGNTVYLRGLTGIAVLILLLAAFNFTNLSAAHSIRRSREVGMRKVLGASRASLVRQFLGESILLTMISLALALVLVHWSADKLFGQMGIDYQLTITDYLTIVPVFAIIAFIVGLFAGGYPALVMSAYNPIEAAKGIIAKGRKRIDVRGALMIVQFSIAVSLIAAGIIVSKQMDYVRDRDLGIDDNVVIALNVEGSELSSRYESIRNVLVANPNVESVARGGELFDGDQGSVPITPIGVPTETGYAMNIYSLDFDFVETLGLEIVQGRAPSSETPTDSTEAIVINETAAALLADLVDDFNDPVGRELQVDQIMAGRVVGVVKDFHFASLHTEINPLVMFFPRSHVSSVFVRLTPGDLLVSDVVQSIETDWATVASDLPFDYTYLDDHLSQLYTADTRFSELVNGLSILTIMIACLGLFGLVSFITELRTKEVGIRKLLGASIPGIVGLISAPFLWYILLSNLIAWPIAFFGMKSWLDGFAYRITLSPGVFVAATLIVLVVAGVTINIQAIRTALRNPISSLRYE